MDKSRTCHFFLLFLQKNWQLKAHSIIGIYNTWFCPLFSWSGWQYTLSLLVFVCIYFREPKKILFREYLFSRMTSFWTFREYLFFREWQVFQNFEKHGILFWFEICYGGNIVFTITCKFEWDIRITILYHEN